MRLYSVSVSLLLGVVLALAGNGLLSTAAAVRLADAGVHDSLTGLILSMYYVGLALGTLTLGRTIARVGHVRAFSAFTALAVAAVLAHGLTAPGPIWLGLRLVTGLCMAATYLTVESWLNAEATPALRGRVLAAYLVALYLGTAFGQMLLPTAPPQGLEIFAIAALLASLAVVPLSLSRVMAPVLEGVDPFPAAALIREAPIGWVGALVSGFIGATIFASAPVFARSAGLSTTEVSYLMTAFVAGGLLGQWPLGWLSDRLERRSVLMGVVVLLAALCGCFLVVAGSPSRLWLPIAFGFGALGFAMYPIAVAHTIDRVGAKRSLPAASQLLLASSLGAIAGPITASFGSPWFGSGSFLVVDAILLLSFLVLALVRMWRVAPVEQGHFQPLARTTPAAHELDPRSPREPARDGG